MTRSIGPGHGEEFKSMSTDINLLLVTDEESLKRKKRVRILNFAAAASLIGVGLASLGVFLLIRAIDPSPILAEQKDVLGKMSQLENRQAKLFILNNRVENIDKVLKIRKDLSRVTSGLLAKIPSDLSIDDFEVNDKSVIMTGQSRSLSAIGEFINNLTDMVYKKEIIKSLTINSLALDESRNSYRISVKSEL